MSAELYGRPVDQALLRLGTLAQAVSVESLIRTDGSDAATRRIRIVNGPLDLELLPDRGLDIGQVRAHGVPLAWISGTGFPQLVPGDADGRGWLRGFGGGMLTTCGLLNFGPPAEDCGEHHPLHGRYSSLRAQVVRAEAGVAEIVVEAIIRESAVFGADLELRRRIELPVGQSVIRVADTLVNRGNREVEPMVLYHVNLGWPLIEEGTRLSSPAREVLPRDAAAAVGLDTWDVFPRLQSEYPEQVFQHTLERGPVEVGVVAPSGLGVRVRFDGGVLPALFQWRVAEGGRYVLGVEPASVPTILGRAVARRRGLLTALAPGASFEFGVEIAVDERGR